MTLLIDEFKLVLKINQNNTNLKVIDIESIKVNRINNSKLQSNTIHFFIVFVWNLIKECVSW